MIFLLALTFCVLDLIIISIGERPNWFRNCKRSSHSTPHGKELQRMERTFDDLDDSTESADSSKSDKSV